MESTLKVLMIGSDRKLFEEGSAVSERIKGYGTLVGELHIVVMTKSSLGLKKKQLAPNVWLYPTNSFSRWFYVRNASKLGKNIVRERQFVRGQSVISTQDPFESGLAGLRVKKKWRLPLEVQMHTDPFSPYFSGPLNFLRKIIAKRVLNSASGIRVVSESLKQKLTAGNLHLKAPISVLPIYVDKEKIESAPVTFDLHARYPWRFIILCVSRL
ncbi:MAG: glycosyltransferase, partial [Parcubacteria group bacterium]